MTDFLIKKHHIHLVKNGRISMAGVNSKNVNYIADAIKDAVVNSKWFVKNINCYLWFCYHLYTQWSNRYDLLNMIILVLVRGFES